jgi:hypothetical protein
MKMMTSLYRWVRTPLVVAGLMLPTIAIGQGTVGLNVAGEVRFPELNNATPQETPLCFNSSSGFLGTCTQISGLRSIAWVATQGGDYASPIQALNEVNNWCGVPGNGNRCLIRIAPGQYDLGSQQLVMRPFVDIQGSGWNMTILGGARGAASVVDAALVKGSVSSVLSQLTIINNGSAGQAYATGYAGDNIATGSDVAPDLDHVTVKVGGDATNSYGVYLRNAPESRLERVWLEIDGNNYCVGLMTEDSGGGTSVNRLRVHTTNKCDSAVAVYFRNTESTVSNSNIDATANGGDVYGVVIEETGTGERLSLIQGSEINAEVEAGSGNAIGAEFRGNGTGAILRSVVGGESGNGNTGNSYGVHFTSSAQNAKVGYSALIGDTASVNDEVTGTKNCVHNIDADLQDVDC